MTKPIIVRTLFFIFLFVCGNTLLSQQKPFKTSCVSWCFHGFGEGVDPEPVIETIGNLGFDGIQLMINTANDLDNLWTAEKIKKVKVKLSEKQLELTSMVIFFPVIADLGSTDPKKVAESLVNFEKSCRIAASLGTKRIEIASPYITELASWDKNGSVGVYKIADADYEVGEKISLRVAPDTDWTKIAVRMNKILSQCSEIAKKKGIGIGNGTPYQWVYFR
ncbi:TIM barrel protein [Maribacter sp. 2-571]|uniref:TIM barrel protein n=1 Tax=Maribacter sp. 2-571 TaxID=3417569 RepID=UPI003D328E94